MRFGDFEVRDKIGAGGMGTVWEVHHPGMKQRFAVKVSTHPRATLPDYRQRFEREVRAMARLRHPNVVRVFDYGVYLDGPAPEAPRRGTPWVVLEYAHGGELDPERITSWDQLRDVLEALLRGLAHSHSRGLIHRDVKPHNLLWVERRGQLVPAVADFGIAHALDRHRPSLVDHFTNRSAEEATGTPRYMAPEQFMGLWRDYGPPTDLYAVGILAFVLACGRAPFTGQNLYQYAAKHLEEPFPELEPSFDVPDSFEPWVRSLTQKKPGDRPPTARAALDALLGEDPPFPTSWRAVEPDDEPGRAPVGLGLFGLQRTYLIGREEERHALWTALEEASGGEVVARNLVGPKGVGKTRLSDWLAELATEANRATTVFRASFSRERPTTSGLAWMLAEHLRCVGMTSQALSERLENILGETWDDEERRGLHQVLCQAESVGSDEPVPTVRASMMIEMSRRVVCEAARSGTVIVQLDDLDEDPAGAGLEFLEALTTGERLPILILATSATAVKSAASAASATSGAGPSPETSGPHAPTVPVAPLEADAFRRLLRDELGLTTEISEVIEKVADGNPQFALQMLEHWLERGDLRTEGNVMVLDATDIPATLEALWSASVERLTGRLAPEAMPVMTAAGVLKSPIEPTEWMATAAELGVDIESPLFGDVSAAMVESGIGAWDDSDRMRLVHPTISGLLSEVGGVEVQQRAHGAAARALTSLHGSNERGLALRVARHFRDSGRPELAWEALEPALDDALDVVDSSEIGEVAEAMLETLDAMSAGPRDTRRARALAFRAIEFVTASRQDDRDRGAALLERARELATGGDAEIVAQVEGVAAWSAISRGGRDEAAEMLENLIADERVSPRTRLMNRMFLTHLNTYRHDDDGVRRHAEVILREADSTAWKLRSREALIHRALAQSDAEEAKEHAFSALILAKQLRRMHLEVHIENLAGFIADLDEGFARAEAHHARSERLAGIVQPQSAVRLMAREYRARAMLRQGKWAEARDLFWSLADEIDAGRAPSVHAWDGLYAAGLALGDNDAIERSVGRALEIARPNTLHVRAAVIAAQQMARRGEAEALIHFVTAALDLFEGTDGVSTEAVVELAALLEVGGASQG